MSVQNEIKNSTIRTLLSSMPIPILGPILTEFFEFRGKLKQNRLNTFIELLENYFTNNVGIKLESFQTQEFGDLFESVLRRVVLTQSNEKMRMFKNIIVNQIEYPLKSIDDAEIYLDLISDLSEMEIKILYEYCQFAKKFEPEILQLNNLEHKLNLLEGRVDKSSPNYNSELSKLQSEFRNKRKRLTSLKKSHNHEHFCISKDQFLFYKQRLFSKALLLDTSVGSIGGKPFKTMDITQFGIQFIDYVMKSS